MENLAQVIDTDVINENECRVNGIIGESNAFFASLFF